VSIANDLLCSLYIVILKEILNVMARGFSLAVLALLLETTKNNNQALCIKSMVCIAFLPGKKLV